MYFWIGYNCWFKSWMFAVYKAANCKASCRTIILIDLEITTEEIGQLLGGN